MDNTSRGICMGLIEKITSFFKKKDNDIKTNDETWEQPIMEDRVEPVMEKEEVQSENAEDDQVLHVDEPLTDSDEPEVAEVQEEAVEKEISDVQDSTADETPEEAVKPDDVEGEEPIVEEPAIEKKTKGSGKSKK